MRVLVLNAGSSSLKHALVDAYRDDVLCRGEQRWEPDASAGRHAAALADALADAGGRADAIGHRVVHGGARFAGPARLDAGVRAAIAELAPLAPLHTGAALEGIDAASATFPDLPQVACFDTAFHRTLPEAAATYALPRAWSERYGLRRYGFHGLNVRWCSEQAERILGAARSRRRVVCHLGSGCSATAVLDGRSVDTTMGFTPLDGLPMATRSGSIDPGLLLHLLASGISREELDDALNHHSGLLGICGLPGLREVQAAGLAGDADAVLAFDVFVRAVSAAIAALTTALNGLDALVFTAGAGEGSALLRAAVCARLGQLGVKLDVVANSRHDDRVDAAGSAVAVLVVAAGEELVIARETSRLLAAGRGMGPGRSAAVASPRREHQPTASAAHGSGP